MKMLKLQILCGCILLFPLICNASNLNSNSMTPEGVNRTFIENYKDMVLAHCVAKAYKDDENAARDAEVVKVHYSNGRILILRKVQEL